MRQKAKNSLSGNFTCSRARRDWRSGILLRILWKLSSGTVFAFTTEINLSGNQPMFKKFIAASALACISLGANAGIIALESSRETGNQGYTGNLGMDFDVLAPIYVTRVGAYDGRQEVPVVGQLGDGVQPIDEVAPIVGDLVDSFLIEVGIFDRNTQTLVAGTFATVTGLDPLDGKSRFVDIADVFLGAGQYSIVARGYSDANKNGNAGIGGTPPSINDGGGLISFVGGARYGLEGNVFAFPTTLDGGPANRYDAGTFEFVAVPVPSSLALLGLGLLMIRRRLAKS
jgi:hypothetical protein